MSHLLATTVLDRNWDHQAQLNFNPIQLKEYHDRTAKARNEWKEKEASYKYHKGFSWEQNNHEILRCYLVFKQTLWLVYMQIKTRV